MNEGGSRLPLLPPMDVCLSPPGKEVTRLSEQESGHGYAVGQPKFCSYPLQMLINVELTVQGSLVITLVNNDLSPQGDNCLQYYWYFSP